jgi:hypothetical protein
MKLAGREMAAITVEFEENELGHPFGTRENDWVTNVDRERRPFKSSANTHKAVMVEVRSQLDDLENLFDFAAGP